MTATGGDTAGRGIGVRWRICGLMTLAGFVAYLLRTNMSVAGEIVATDSARADFKLWHDLTFSNDRARPDSSANVRFVRRVDARRLDSGRIEC